MFEIIFIVLMFMIFGRLAYYAVCLTWGFSKVLLTLIFLPFTLFVAIIGGLISFALPVLAVIGILSLIFVRK